MGFKMLKIFKIQKIFLLRDAFAESLDIFFELEEGIVAKKCFREPGHVSIRRVVLFDQVESCTVTQVKATQVQSLDFLLVVNALSENLNILSGFKEISAFQQVSWYRL